MQSKNLLMSLALCLLMSPAARAEDEPSWIKDTSGIGRDDHGVVRSDQFLEMGAATPGCLQLEGESLLRMGDLGRAITVLQKAVEQAPLDMDKRILYTQALQKKLISQKPKDPKLYNFLVKQWFFIYKKAEFPDQVLQGKQNILNLTGRLPTLWDKPQKFLSQVLLPEDGSEKVSIGKKRLAEK